MTGRAKTQDEPVRCCRAWMLVPPTKRDQWEWQATHQFGHSRTAFTAPTLAGHARVTGDRAAELIAEAQRLEWIWTPQPGVWVGQLPTRR